MTLNRRNLLAMGLLATPVLASAASAEGSFPGRLVRYPLFPSAHIRPRQVVVWLPADYEESGKTYPVIYMHDGQNLFDPREAYGGVTWGIAEALSAPRRPGGIPKAIVVGVYNSSLRHREYMPQAIYGALPARVRAAFDGSVGGSPISDSYVRFLADELKPFIDRTYRTKPQPDQTSLMGSSMGGLISFYGLMERPDCFGRAACLSPHWPFIVPNMIGANTPTPKETQAAVSGYVNSRGPDLKGRVLYLDRGDQTLDALYQPYQDPIIENLKGRRGLKLSYRAFPGAAHNEASWKARLDTPLAVLLLGAD